MPLTCSRIDVYKRQWLCKELKLGSKDVVRHYDINGKLCPKYYVEHEDAWVQFRKDVDAAIKEL